MSAINIQLNKVESLLAKATPNRIRLSSESLKRIDESLEIVDAKIGEFGLVSIGEFIADIIEVFCQYTRASVDTYGANIVRANELIEQMLVKVGPKLRAVIPEYEDKRLRNWGLLLVSQRLQARAEQLEEGASAVRKLFFSFEGFYKSMIRLNDDFGKMFRRFNGMKFENNREEAMIKANEEAGCPDLTNRNVKKEEMVRNIYNKWGILRRSIF